MTTKEMIEVMQAYEEGKTVQVFSCGNWVDIKDPSWDWVMFKYRIKPEKKYRPYEDADEMIEDWKERFKPKDWPSYSMPLIWVMNKDTGKKSVINDFGTYHVTAIFSNVSMAALFEDFTYLDGSPCGKEIEE